jgi:hypothetical protein
MASPHPNQKFSWFVISVNSVLELKVGADQVIVAFFNVASADKSFTYVCPYYFLEYGPAAVAQFIDALTYDDMNLSGKRYLPYSVKIIAQEAGSTRFVPSAPIAINELGGKGSLNFVILRHDNVVDKVSVTARINATGYSFTIPLSQHDFPSDVDAAVHPVPGGYVPLGIYNNYTDAELKIQEVARPYLAGPRLPKPKYLNQPGYPR